MHQNLLAQKSKKQILGGGIADSLDPYSGGERDTFSSTPLGALFLALAMIRRPLCTL